MAFRGNGIGHRVASMSPTGTNGRGKPGGVKLTLNTK